MSNTLYYGDNLVVLRDREHFPDQGLGQHMGRPPKLTDAQEAEARRRRAQGATLAELARSYGVGKSTISRLAAQT